MNRIASKGWLRLLVTVLFLSSIPALNHAQAPRKTIRVATRLIQPFVVQDGKQLTGFSIELWENLADRMGIEYRYVVEPTVLDLLKAVKSGKADLGISAISITHERDKDFDFSQPMFEAGLQIMTRVEGSANPNGLGSLGRKVLASGVLLWLLYIFVFGLVPAHIVWISERKNPKGILNHPKYFPGIFEAYWWTLACLATQAEEMPKSVLGRFVAVFWMFTAVVFIAFFTAQITASATVEQLRGTINGPDDLPGKRIATTTGSTSASYLKEHDCSVSEFAKIEDAYEALGRDEVDAVVFDSPVLQYFTTHEGKGRFQMVGSVFRKHYYGIVFPPSSPNRKPVQWALLAEQESGEYTELYERWFGGK